MARTHKYRRNGQYAFVEINGKRISLGRYGTPESRRRYHEAVSNHFREKAAPEQPVSSPSETTIAILANEYRKHAFQRYHKNGKPTSEIKMIRYALTPVVQHYGHQLARDFGPLALQTVRDMLAEKYCRTKVNDHLSRIKRVFKWGVSQEMVEFETYARLTTVPGLRIGQGEDRPPVTTVSQEQIDAVKPFVSEQVWSMIQFQLLTGSRPGEATMIRTCDIEQTPGGWLYRPESHKTQHHGKARVILIGPKAQEILRPWLKPDQPAKYLFSALEAWKSARSRSAPQWSKRQPGERYSSESYGRAIMRACDKARIDRWRPNQLRHNAATRIRRECSAEMARIILGHSKIDTTEIYAERDLQLALQFVTKFS